MQTEYYAGLFTSSAKVTLHLASQTLPGAPEPEVWECHVCGNRNPPGTSPAASRVCTLCGVRRESSSTPSTPAPAASDAVACPACTYLNSPSNTTCEICTAELPVPLAPEISLIKLSFRKGGDKAFYSNLQSCLKTKAWVCLLHSFCGSV